MKSSRLLLGFLAATIAAAQDSPVRIEQSVEAQYPASLFFSPISSGEAHLVITVEANGELGDILVAGYTNRAFADEAVRTLKHWHYEPAYQNGQPIGVRMELRFSFSATGRVVSLTPLETIDSITQSWLPKSFVSRVCTPRELDRPVQPLQTVDPGNPGNYAAKPSEKGAVLLDFYVDEKGQARMPVVLKTTHETYAHAAVWALSQWRFATPTRRGEPVAVRVQQRFVFPGGS